MAMLLVSIPSKAIRFASFLKTYLTRLIGVGER
jgi:hypothetical protein